MALVSCLLALSTNVYGRPTLLVITTAFEFISALSMKGFLVGAFFAIKGLFQPPRVSSAILLLPFFLPHSWKMGQFSS